MNPIRINRATLSELVWSKLPYIHRPLGYQFEELERLRAQADYNTGSISDTDAIDLQHIVSHFQPMVVAEVGTFIGRSTAAMALAMPKGGVIHTCDASNAIALPELNPDVQVVQYPRKGSTEMFEGLISAKAKVDLFYIDGRLSPKDTRLVWELAHDKTVIVLDDFEGVEKGVANAMLLLQQFPNYALVYPRDIGKTAMMLPSGLLQFTAQ
jgi:predicted O-methyltransferase YrrM